MTRFLRQRTAARSSRAFLRIPVRIPASVCVDNEVRNKVLITTISASGVSVVADSGSGVPDLFELRFRLPGIERTLGVQAEVKNRSAMPDGVKSGCDFVDVPKEDERCIAAFVSGAVKTPPAATVAALAALACAVDAAWGLIARPSGLLHGAALVLYLASAILASVFIFLPIGPRGGRTFRTGLVFLAAAFAFIIIRNAACLTAYTVLTPWIALAFFAGLACILGLASLKRIDAIADAIKRSFV